MSDPAINDRATYATTDRPVVPERLFGVPGAEQLWSDIATCYESDIEPWVEPAEEPEPGRSTSIEEWTVRDATDHLPPIDWIVDHVCEWAADNGMLDEYGFEDFERHGRDEDVVRAFQAALNVWSSKVHYRMADQHVATYTITWDDEGEPLVDGERMYGVPLDNGHTETSPNAVENGRSTDV